MKDYTTLQVDIQKLTATVWLNRPEVQNAVNTDMLQELTEVFRHLNDDETIRTIILRGKGKSFCAGADLKGMLAKNNSGYEENFREGKLWTECLRQLYHLSKPLIAVVQGNVFGGGNGLVAAADIVLAEAGTVFSFSEVKIGLAPSTILPYVLTRVNEHKAALLMFTGKKFKTDEALTYNLVDLVAGSEELESTLENLLNDINSGSPGGIKEVKHILRRTGNGLSQEQMDQITADSIARLKISDEAFEGISAFLEKRPPEWNKNQ
ncbi:MAG: enoyl-CoA hydratase-related protein [Bacteroidales bacterium]|jgi:methylglutaconyl-CoA hydratase|nr:enoyl-CoA hydratase-related protein [Bacteroidales bacterium]